MPEVMSRLLLNAQLRVQLGVVSLSNPLFCPVGTLAHGDYDDYLLLHSQYASILGKVDGGGFEENSTCTAVVSRADRACCADTSRLQ